MQFRRNLVEDRVSQLEYVPPLTIEPSATVREAMARMREHHRGCILVCEGEQLVGIFTERDVLMRICASGGNLDDPVTTHMTRRPITTSPVDSVGGLVTQMLKGGYRHMPVVDQGKPVGVVSVKGLIHYLAEHFPAAVYNLPPEPGQIHSAREGA